LPDNLSSILIRWHTPRVTLSAAPRRTGRSSESDESTLFFVAFSCSWDTFRAGGAGMQHIGRDLRVLAAGVALVFCVASLRAADAPKRINRAIELLEQGQPIYYTGSHEGTEGNFEQGVKDAQTYADYISYDMEHAPFDVKGLAEYMKGLVKG